MLIIKTQIARNIPASYHFWRKQSDKKKEQQLFTWACDISRVSNFAIFTPKHYNRKEDNAVILPVWMRIWASKKLGHNCHDWQKKKL